MEKEQLHHSCTRAPNRPTSPTPARRRRRPRRMRAEPCPPTRTAISGATTYPRALMPGPLEPSQPVRPSRARIRSVTRPNLIIPVRSSPIALSWIITAPMTCQNSYLARLHRRRRREVLHDRATCRPAAAWFRVILEKSILPKCTLNLRPGQRLCRLERCKEDAAVEDAARGLRPLLPFELWQWSR